jgi:hypothetical protein
MGGGGSRPAGARVRPVWWRDASQVDRQSQRGFSAVAADGGGGRGGGGGGGDINSPAAAEEVRETLYFMIRIKAVAEIPLRF